MDIQKSITKNFIYNITLTLATILFPIVTFPYVARIIGAEGIGKVGFVTSVVNYFLIFACLGIPIYGLREIAKARDEKVKVSRIYSEIFIINLISSLASFIVFILMIITFSFFRHELLLYLIIGLNLFLNIFNIDWLYKGFEDYQFITLRSLAVKILSAFLIFFFVKTKSDYMFYGVISVLALSGSNIINIISAKKFVKFSVKDINLRRHLKPIFMLFSTQLAINIYANLDSTLVGVIAGEKYVGYYTAAIKINKVFLGIVTSLGVVLVPRLSYYIKNNLEKEFNDLVIKSIKFILFLGLPACASLYVLSPQIIRLFSGAEFLPSILTMKITIPIILFIGFSNLTGIQILMSINQERYLFISVLMGAVVNLILNLLLIPVYKHNGAAITTCFVEFIILLIQLQYTKRYMKGKIINISNISYLIGSFLVFAITYIVSEIGLNDLLTIIVSVILGTVFYVIVILLYKDPLGKFVLNKLSILRR
jgi:O-antigen/teichoic acid export membrane protein